MAKYRRRIEEVEAYQYSVGSIIDAPGWVIDAYNLGKLFFFDGELYARNGCKVLHINSGDYIVKSVENGIKPFSDLLFAELFEETDGQALNEPINKLRIVSEPDTYDEI